MVQINDLVYQLQNGSIDGKILADLVAKNEISKGDRRKITKLAANFKKTENLSERQKLRLAVKEKKALPKLTRDDRKQKFQKELDTARDKEAANFTVCLGCRKRGHFLKDCPKAPVALECNTVEICYNCGSYDHALRNCPEKRTGALKFASCFICKQTGHISRDCPQNVNGLYPNGGCCHICLLKTHLVKDCPQKGENDEKESNKRNVDGVAVKGLTVMDNSAGGDDIQFDYEENDKNEEDNDSDEDKQPKKKHKSSKKLKKDKH